MHRRAVVHRLAPFTIRLKDRCVEESALQSLVLKVDPGSKTTGMALARVEQTGDGEVHHAVHLAEIRHRGEQVHTAMGVRARARQRRRSAHLRYRKPRFKHRRRPKGWLPPSLRSRLGNVLTWASRYQRWAPLTRIDVERVRFDMQLLQNPDAAAVNATRCALMDELRRLGVSLTGWSGGRTHWNRARFSLIKTHALDALCVGDLAGVDAGALRTLRIRATGRGQYCRTLLSKHGFPRGYLMRQKRVEGFQTGDLVLAVVPPQYTAQGRHQGRVAVRKSGFFRIAGVDSIPAHCCTLLQRGDGYEYAVTQAAGVKP